MALISTRYSLEAALLLVQLLLQFKNDFSSDCEALLSDTRAIMKDDALTFYLVALLPLLGHRSDHLLKLEHCFE